MAVAAYAHYYMLILIPLILGLCMDIVQKIMPSTDEVSKLLRLTKSPIISQMQDSMEGSSTIRVFGQVERFKQRTRLLLNKNIKAVVIENAISAWFAIRIDFLSILLMAFISAMCILLRAEDQDDSAGFEPILLSILLSYVLNIQSTLVWVLKYFVQINSNMINAERCMAICDIVSEI